MGIPRSHSRMYPVAPACSILFVKRIADTLCSLLFVTGSWFTYNRAGGWLSNQTKPYVENSEAIEKQTAKLPSDSFLWLAFGSIAASLALKSRDDKRRAFRRAWTPTFPVLSVYNKLVKQLGSDRVENGL